MRRRAALGRLAAALAAARAPALRGQALARVLVLGGGWAGLAVAHALARLGAPVQVELVDRQPQWLPLPLSNPWLAGLAPHPLAPLDLATLARRGGWRFTAAEVTGIDLPTRRVHTPQGPIGWDWLVLATGASADHGAWPGTDTRAQARVRERFGAGFAAAELPALRQRLQAFEHGTLLMTVPPAPYRCPPAPYERALLLAEALRRRGAKARLVLLDAGAGMPRFNRLFAERWRGWVEHRPHSRIQALDPFAQTVTTDDGELAFDEALLLPPMHAGPLVAAAGLQGQDAQGRATGWAAVQPDTLRAPANERVYLAGDLLDRVSPLFGAYPKTAHIAAELGAAVATQLAAAVRGQPPPEPAPPRSQCHVWLNAEPPEQLVLEASHRRRGDGLLVQALRQHDNPQPRGEDLAWARALLAERLGVT